VEESSRRGCTFGRIRDAGSGRVLGLEDSRVDVRWDSDSFRWDSDLWDSRER
jgi:hypothetical protein